MPGMPAYQHKATNVAAEQRRVSEPDPRADIMGCQEEPADADLVQQMMDRGGKGLRVVAVGRAIGVALPGQIERNDFVAAGKQGHDLAPRKPAFREAGEKHHDIAIGFTADDVVQPNAVDRLKAMLKSRQVLVRPGGRESFDFSR